MGQKQKKGKVDKWSTKKWKARSSALKIGGGSLMERGETKMTGDAVLITHPLELNLPINQTARSMIRTQMFCSSVNVHD